MNYFMIILILITMMLLARLLFLHRAIKSILRQMEEIKQHPEQNRQLKTIAAAPIIENLHKKINDLYSARQTERILYQRKEARIRQEIENISHDLRTPLTSILGYLELILDKATDERERQEFLLIILRRAKLLQGFIQDFYEISRMEADNYPFQFEVLPVQSLVKEAVVAYYHEFECRKIQVEAALEEAPCYVIADKTQFNRILNNLIQNALKYTEDNFSVSQYTKDYYCYIKFSNDTKILQESELPYIFERSYTGDHSRSGQSSGLGLSITKLLVEKMNGQIRASFEDNRFVIEIKWKLR